jgi:glycosyltransferase involved in cell wall biosynthesis
MARTRISIVTPSFNQAEYIERTIRSVLDQTGDFELEYHVMDGGSTDGTVEILKSFGDRIAWTSGPDGGQIDAINRGLRAATGNLVGWINSDDLLLPDDAGAPGGRARRGARGALRSDRKSVV